MQNANEKVVQALRKAANSGMIMTGHRCASYISPLMLDAAADLIEQQQAKEKVHQAWLENVNGQLSPAERTAIENFEMCINHGAYAFLRKNDCCIAIDYIRECVDLRRKLDATQREFAASQRREQATCKGYGKKTPAAPEQEADRP